MFASVERLEQTGTAHVQNVVYTADKTQFVEFEYRAELQAHESEVAGRPIYKNVLYTIIRTAGDNKSSVIRRTREVADRFGPSDIEKYSRQWAAFKGQNETVQDGIPLTEWPLLTKADVLNLKARNIHTVEALAGLSDGMVQNIGLGGLQLREKARAYIGGDAEISRLVQAKAEADERIRALEKTVAELVAANKEKQDDKAANVITAAVSQPAEAQALSAELQKTLATPVVRRPGRQPKNQEN